VVPPRSVGSGHSCRPQQGSGIELAVCGQTGLVQQPLLL